VTLWGSFLDELSVLQIVNITALPQKERAVFFLNLYHVMVTSLPFLALPCLAFLFVTLHASLSIRCAAVPYNTIPYHAMLYNAIPYITTHSNAPHAMYFNAIPCYAPQVIHGSLVIGPPPSWSSWPSFFNNIAYLLSFDVVGIAEVEHNLLR
jgi:hypothetical protein